jgi:hypothetical protein
VSGAVSSLGCCLDWGTAGGNCGVGGRLYALTGDRRRGRKCPTRQAGATFAVGDPDWSNVETNNESVEVSTRDQAPEHDERADSAATPEQRGLVEEWRRLAERVYVGGLLPVTIKVGIGGEGQPIARITLHSVRKDRVPANATATEIGCLERTPFHKTYVLTERPTAEELLLLAHCSYLHELFEWFTLDGKLVADPHPEVSGLPERNPFEFLDMSRAAKEY